MPHTADRRFDRALIARALARGWRRRCPHCGQGPLFTRWGVHIPRCTTCGLIYERNAGDTWLFTIVGDRIPIAILIAVVYFGVSGRHMTVAVTVFAGAAVVLLWTAPRRWGVGIALHYLSRVYFPDPADPIPEPSTNAKNS